jgi:hypothetical protein
MVTSALWSDVDGDGWPDLLLTLEWGNVRYFHNNQGKGFEDWTERAGFASAGTGWWTSIAAADFNGDGRPTTSSATSGSTRSTMRTRGIPPCSSTGTSGATARQLIEAYYEGDQIYPWRSRKGLGAAIPSVLKRFPRTTILRAPPSGEILGEERLAKARRFEATELRSGVFLSQPDGTYRFEPLPRIAQISRCRAWSPATFCGSGFADIYRGAELLCADPVRRARFDGGLGQLLRGDGRGPSP